MFDEDSIFKPRPIYPSDYYDDKGELHENFEPPLKHLASIENLDVKIDEDNIDELRLVAGRLKQIQIAQCRVNFACFLEFCYIDPVTKKGFELQWYHKQWIQAIEENKRTLIISHRGSGKTSIVIPYIVFSLGKNPDLRVKICTADDATSVKRLEVVKRTIEKNKRVAEIFPDLVPDRGAGWAKTSIFVKRSIIDPEPSLEGKGIFSSIVGARVDLLIFDDIVSLQNSIVKPAERQHVIASYENDWLNLCVETTRIVFIATPYHREDATHKIMKGGAYKKLFYQIKDNFGSMWPDRIGEHVLRDKRLTMSASAWSRGYRCEPIADTDRIIQEAWIKYTDIDLQSMQEDGWVFFTSYDVATRLKERNDYFASVTSAVNPATKDIIIVDAWHDKLTKSQQALMIYREYMRYKPFRVLVEIVGNESLDQRILENYPELAGILEPVNPKNSKFERLNAVTPFIENGHVKFASHLDPDNPKFNDRRGNLVFELVEFPADHDDLADSWSQNLDGVRRYHLDQYQWLKDNQEVEVFAF